MISSISGNSLQNTSLPDLILEAILTASKAVSAIRIENLPQLWESMLEGLKNIGKALLMQVKDFFFKDLPGLIIDVGCIAVGLARKQFNSVLPRAKSALKHLTKILEVLSLIPICSLICSILLATIYLCQQDWVNAVFALI